MLLPSSNLTTLESRDGDDKNPKKKFQKVKDFSYQFNKKGVSIIPPELQKINLDEL